MRIPHASAGLRKDIIITVKDLEETLGRVSAGGGKVLFPKMSIGEYGFIAHFEDSAGNRVALHAE